MHCKLEIEPARLESLTEQELFDLHRVLKTIGESVAAFGCQPCFRGKGKSGGAGEILADIDEWLSVLRIMTVQQAVSRRPADQNSVQHRGWIQLAELVECKDGLAEAASVAAQAAFDEALLVPTTSRPSDRPGFESTNSAPVAETPYIPPMAAPAGVDRPAPADAIRKSYKMLALLSVCEESARNLAESDRASVPAVAGELANVIEIARELAGEVHDAMEIGWAPRAPVDQRGPSKAAA